jgi:wobble nucleotide-excising tRNase
MIHKIERLISVGKFGNYQATGDVAFRKLTLFYADNGSGKTTVSSVFRSLAENDPTRILKRRTISSTIPQEVSIIQRPIGSTTNVTHSFNSNSWHTRYSNIEVFDIHFVDENIYSGCSFNEEHKKQLHQFVIGAQSVLIQQQIDQNKTDKATSKSTQQNLENQIVLGVANGMLQSMITQFLNISANSAQNIDVKISAAETALTNASANAVIQTLELLTNQASINAGINFDVLQTDLQTDIQGLQDVALQQLFDAHCTELESHGITDAKTWINMGFQYHSAQLLASEPLDCPFCKQSLSNPLDLITAYTAIFNTVFNDYIAGLNAHLETLNNLNLEVEIQRILNQSTSNAAKITSWNTHLTNGATTPATTIIDDPQLLRDGLTNLIALVKQKIANPSQTADISNLTAFKSLLQSTNLKITTHNADVSTYNTAINTFRAGIQTVVQAQNSLNELKRIKRRFDPTISTLCTQLKGERQNLKTLEGAYTILSQQQQSAAQTFFTTYKDKINHYLQTVFKTPFLIDNVVHIAPQGRATQNKINYRLTLNGQEISFDPTRDNNAKDCLSEGDKSTIALAFFLSKLDIDPNKSDKVLIFDDPLSSFDSNRRMYTVQLIQNLLPQIKQVIVLSHNEHFLYELFKLVAAGDKKTLRIYQNYVTGHSAIEEFDLKKLVENDYFKHVKELEAFLQYPDIDKKDTVLGWLRNVLEAHIRFKFYRQLRSIPPNDQTFGRVITTLANSATVFRDNNRQQVIDLLNLINKISCKPHHGEPTPDYVSLGVDPATMNETELCNFINNTIDLIDNRL